MPSNQIGGEFWQAVRLTFSRAILDPNILAFQIAGFPKTLSEVPQLRRCPRQPDMQNSNHRHQRYILGYRKNPIESTFLQGVIWAEGTSAGTDFRCCLDVPRQLRHDPRAPRPLRSGVARCYEHQATPNHRT